MNLWILVIHKPLIVKFYKSKYHSASLTATKPLECFEPFSIGKQMFWCVLIIKNINFRFFFSMPILWLWRYITQEGHKLETGAPRPPATVTNAVSWRSEGIKYRKNEVFLDVIESVNLLVGTLYSNFCVRIVVGSVQKGFLYENLQ